MLGQTHFFCLADNAESPYSLCRVDLPGGPLQIQWSQENNHIYMTGPAELSFEGRLPGDDLLQADGILSDIFDDSLKQIECPQAFQCLSRIPAKESRQACSKGPQDLDSKTFKPIPHNCCALVGFS